MHFSRAWIHSATLIPPVQGGLATYQRRDMTALQVLRGLTVNFSTKHTGVLRGLSKASAAVGLSLAALSAQAGFTNGGFETGDFSGWTLQSYTWVAPYAIPTFPPTTEADLGLATAADNGLSSVLTTGTDTNTGGALSYPLYGSNAARLNNGGNNYRVSSIAQTATILGSDVDAVDGKVHVRFTIAPVLQNPGHPQEQQPYFFVEVRNVTKGTQLFHTFNFSGQVGVPWVTVGGYQYTDWQAIDIAPGAGALDVGDQVSIKIIAAGCGQSGHEGHVYVDSGPTGTFLPGLLVAATGPATAGSGTDITYTYTYQNAGTAAGNNVAVAALLPPGTTFVSATNPAGGTCTGPGVGNAGTVNCALGTVPIAGSGTFTITVHIDPTAVGPINNGTYPISADGVPPLLGPLVTTNLLIDLATTISASTGMVKPGAPITYTVNVVNNGPSVAQGAVVTSPVPAGLTGVTWTCVAAGGATCTASGSDAINDTVNLPVGGSLVYTVSAIVGNVAEGTTITKAVSVTLPPFGLVDNNLANNNASVTATNAVLPVPSLGSIALLLLSLMLAGYTWVVQRQSRA